jgi:hypothetical protein
MEYASTELNPEQALAAALRGVLSKNLANSWAAGPLRSVLLPKCQSNVVRTDRTVSRCFALTNLAGLFDKGHPATLHFGRVVCDEVKHRFESEGFFTSDEFTRLKLGVLQQERVRFAVNTPINRKDLIFVLLYDDQKARKIQEYIIDRLAGLSTLGAS